MLLRKTNYYARVTFFTHGITQAQVSETLNIGAVTLECKGRKFVLDTYETNYNTFNKNKPTDVEFMCKLQEDHDTFPIKENYTLRVDDLLSKDLKATFYCDNEVGMPTFEVRDIEVEINFGIQKLIIECEQE